MLFMTEADERYTVKCSCGGFTLSFRNRPATPRAMLRCVICGARASVTGLVRAWQAEADPGDRAAA